MSIIKICCYKYTARMLPKSEETQKEKDGGSAINIVVIGDEAVGKSSLLFAYQNESLVASYNPTSM